ncbi:MAG: hypothetical protein LBQ66_16265, partial [Planctomycetaceae bacterium]|nr:hypothetical protein [Planctomycetaceae bacterium]
GAGKFLEFLPPKIKTFPAPFFGEPTRNVGAVTNIKIFPAPFGTRASLAPTLPARVGLGGRNSKIFPAPLGTRASLAPTLSARVGLGGRNINALPAS